MKSTPRKFITFSVTYYRGTPFFKSVRVVTTPSRKHTVTLQTLSIITLSLNASLMILSSPQGLITHRDAMCRRVSGQILAIIG